jgi:hypothetical protein
LWLGFVLILLAGSGVVAGMLLLLGFNLNPFRKAKEDPFVVRIPINAQPIPAYQRVAREHLMNPATGEITSQRIPPAGTIGMSIVGAASDGSHVEGRIEAVRNVNDQVVFKLADGREIAQGQVIELGGALMNVNAIIGRVVKKDKRAGMGFREDTFFPQGTPEGVAGATPRGMRAITLDASKLTGVHALNAGDRIDLMASVPLDDLASFQSHSHGRLAGTVVPASASKGDDDTATEPLLLAQDAVVLKPVYVRNEATTSSSLTQGQRVQNVPKYEVAIAVAPDDVIPLQSALDKSLAITCITHSMQPTSDDAKPSPPVAGGPLREVPVTVRAIPAYEVVTREAFVSPATRRMRMEPMSELDIARQGIITSLDEALGTVARHDIPAGRFLRKADLLSGALKQGAVESSKLPARQAVRNVAPGPIRLVSEHVRPAALQQTEDSGAPSIVGDRPAVTRFVPAGHTAFALPWNRIYGAEHLQIGDKLDLLASYSLESENEEEETETRPDGTKIVRNKHDLATRETLRTWDESLGFRGESWFVAGDAVVVGPVGFPPPAAAQRALGQSLTRPAASGDAASFSGPPLLIAVDDRDVEAMAAALAGKRVLFTAAFQPSQSETIAEQGLTRIAIAAQDVPAYEQFTETVWNGNRRRPLSRIVSAGDGRFADALTPEQMKQYEYRVLGRAKRRGEFFTADDFLPEGTKPGVAAAAQPGVVIYSVADHEIEGLDAFQAGDRIAVLIRGVVKAPDGVLTHGLSLERPVSSVIVPQATIARASRGGQTVLAVRNEDLTRLQAAWAASVAQDGAESGGRKRSHLLAVALPHEPTEKPNLNAPKAASRRIAGQAKPASPLPAAAQVSATTPAPDDAIPSFDPASDLTLMEAMVGGRRQVHAFPAGRPRSSGSAVPSLNFVTH